MTLRRRVKCVLHWICGSDAVPAYDIIRYVWVCAPYLMHKFLRLNKE